MNLDKKERKMVVLNNLGVCYIEKDDCFTAIMVLRKALKKCERVVKAIEQKQTQKQNSQKNVEEDTYVEEEALYHLDSWMADKNIMNRPSYDNTKDLDQPYSMLSLGSISRRTIAIPQFVPECKAHMLPVAIIFNLALAYHVYAIEKNTDMEMLKMAAQLYDLVLDYHLTTDAPQSTCLIFLMTCLNNLGQLHRELHDDEMSNFFFEKLISLLMCMVDSYPSDERPCDLDDYFLNTMHLILPSCSVVAAAA